MEHVNCVTHCRRKFEKGKTSPYELVQQNVKQVLSLFRKIYAMEQGLRKRDVSFEERQRIREQDSGLCSRMR